MAFSIESRVPYLDQEFVDHILHLPDTAIVQRRLEPLDPARSAQRAHCPRGSRLRRWKVGFTTRRCAGSRRAARPSRVSTSRRRSRHVLTGRAPRSWPRSAPAAAARWKRACSSGVPPTSSCGCASSATAAWCSRRRRRGGADGAGGDRPQASWQHRGGRRRARAALLAAAAGPQGPAAAAEAGRLLAEYGPTTRSTFSPLSAERSTPVSRSRPTSSAGATIWTSSNRRQVVAHAKPGDVVVMAESPSPPARVAATALDEIHPTKLAKVLSKAVTKTPHGIGSAFPRRCSSRSTKPARRASSPPRPPRPPASWCAGAAGSTDRRRQRRGDRRPYLEHIAAAQHARQAGSGRSGRRRRPSVGAAQRGCRRTRRVRRHRRQRSHGHRARCLTRRRSRLVATLMRDNPLGQGHEQTPVCVLRPLGLDRRRPVNERCNAVTPLIALAELVRRPSSRV